MNTAKAEAEMAYQLQASKVNLFKSNKLGKLGDAIAISKSETLNH